MTPLSAPTAVQPSRGAARIADYAVMALAIVLGVGSVILFVWTDRPILVRMGLSAGAAAGWNALVSLLFFAQHSILVRRPVRARLAAVVPARYDGACYAITSGIALALVSLLFQPTGPPLFVLESAARLAVQAAVVLAVAGFAWSAYALHGFDMLGLRAIRQHLRRDGVNVPDTRPRPGAFVVRGPYRWVRHPLYSCVIVLLWADPAMSLGRLVIAASWTAWIWVGATLEERDLVTDFGQRYEEYRAQVPMLVPWRGRAQVETDRSDGGPRRGATP